MRNYIKEEPEIDYYIIHDSNVLFIFIEAILSI